MTYRIEQLTATPPSFLELDEVKIWLRQDCDDDDELIKDIIEAALEEAESYTRRVFKTTQYKMHLDQFLPYDECFIRLPRSPLISVDSINYYNTDGNLTLFAATEYGVDDGKDIPARIYLLPEKEWPNLEAGRRNAVEITFTCGWKKPGTTEDWLPARIKQAMRIMITHWYENRAEVEIGMAVNQVPKQSRYLLDSVKIVEDVNL